MDMKLVVQTCVLSKRWNSLWSSTPYLSFDMNVGDDDDYGIYFDKYILVESHVYSWLLVAIKRDVQELCLESDIDVIPILKLPYNLFTSGITKFVCKSDTLMSMSMCTSKSIKSLHLEEVTLPKGNSDAEVILSCPVLEDLFIKYFNYENVKCFTISALRLHKLELLSRNYNEITIKICSPNLTSLKCGGYISRQQALVIKEPFCASQCPHHGTWRQIRMKDMGGGVQTVIHTTCAAARVLKIIDITLQ
ncbi:hypothetical protein AQUCO_07800003v1 [Aquilegia coerulea]|uniref:FBD domain-containing protein n=1 Tax=Aquilegia coerulea TaxID=218851 RepID=A0A2G5C7W5_AQUCA|nr:hypothetical protein AQUCO_07800003v1 [Aquilegia coerulea]